jgi:two-component system nitrate/nitrite response regulator NarL
MIEVVLVDSHSLFGDLLAPLLAEHGFRLLGPAATVDDALAELAALRPPLCLVDPSSVLSSPSSGAAVVERLASVGGTRVVVLAGDTRTPVPDALAAGAVGYLEKDCAASVLVSALNRVLEGATVVETAEQLERAALDDEDDLARRRAATLTIRERECLRLVMDGATTAAMARELGVSPPTVRSHVQSLLGKLGVHSRVEAAILAERLGLVEGRRPFRAG